MILRPLVGFDDLAFGATRSEVEKLLGTPDFKRDAAGLGDSVVSLASYSKAGIGLGFSGEDRWLFLSVGNTERATVLWKRMPFAIASQPGEPNSSIKHWLAENGLAFEEASGDFGRTICVPAQGVTFSFDDLTGELLGIQLRATAGS